MTHSDSTHDHPGRLREHPDVRFAAPRHQFDLRAVAKELTAEPSTTPVHGHRQQTLYRHGRHTVALFTFDPGASLPRHTADGTVTINVLQGRMRVRTPDGVYDLPAGHLLVLASGVPHDVSADAAETQATLMLLQVHLDESPAATSRE